MNTCFCMGNWDTLDKLLPVRRRKKRHLGAAKMPLLNFLLQVFKQRIIEEFSNVDSQTIA